MNNKYPKILFLTVNGWNNTTGTSTITSIIKEYPKENIANIYLRADKPNSEVCDRYFRIDELKVLKSIFNRKIKTGYRVEKSDTNEVDFTKERETQVNLKKRKNSLTPFIRDFVWKVGSWKRKELKEFIIEFDPDLIIFPAEALIHFNNLGMYVSKLVKKPFGLFFWDDNFTYIPVNGFMAKMYRYFQRQNIKKIAKKSSFSFAINEKMQQECGSELGLNPKLLTKPIVETINRTPYKHSGDIIKILYTGSIYIGRGETILTLIEEIKKINAGGGNFFLEIYTNSDLSEEEKAKYNNDGVSKLFPPVTKEEVLKLQQESDVLLFVEALNGEYRNAARLSFSTKITDYLSARKCILAIGPFDIAPMGFFKNNDIAFTAENPEQIHEILHMIDNDSETMSFYAEKSYEFGLKNHSTDVIFKTFMETVIKFAK